MSLSPTRLARIVAHAGCMLFISATLGVSSSQAKEERKASSEDAIEQIAPLSHHNYGDVITELPPLKPYKKNAATKPAKPSQAASQAKASSRQKVRTLPPKSSRLLRLPRSSLSLPLRLLKRERAPRPPT